VEGGGPSRSMAVGECEGGTVIDRAAKVPKNSAALRAADHVMSVGGDFGAKGLGQHARLVR